MGFLNQHINTLIVAAVMAIIGSLVTLNVQMNVLNERVENLEGTIIGYHKEYDARFGRLENLHIGP